MLKRIVKVLELLRDTYNQWNDDQAPRQAAALSYYTLFSMAPLLVVLIALVGAVYGEQAVRNQIAGQLEGTVGTDAAELIQSLIANARRPEQGIISTVLGTLTLVLGALGLFGNLQATLNTIWKVPPRPQPTYKNRLMPVIRSVLQTVRKKLLAFSMVIIFVVLIIVLLIANTLVNVASREVVELVPASQRLLQVSSFALSWLVTTVLFALIYKVLPDANIRWREVWIGAAFTAFLFSIGRLALSAYLAFSSTTSAYGAAGSLVLILLWVYYSAQIILFGAEFTYVYAQRCRTAMELGADDCLDPQPAETTDATQPESEPAGTLSTEVTDEPQRSRQPETAGGGG